MRFLEGIDLVVVNYRTPQDLKSFASSLLAYSPSIPFTLYVMNNEPDVSDIKASAMIVDLFENVVVTNSENIYYSGACNLGVSLGSRETVAVLNADTKFCRDTIDRCYRALMENPGWGALGPLQYGDKKEVTHGGIFGTPSHPSHRGWRSRALHEFRDVRPAVTLSGSAVFFTRESWNDMWNCPIYREKYPDVAGAFLPTTHYYEETWFCYHLNTHGYTPMYFGEAEMVHRWHKASPTGGWADQQFKVSRVLFREMCDYHGMDHD